MSQPKVSIIVPIYGVEKYIHQCVDSILAQTLKEIEIILVDDGSKDNCPAIVDEYVKKDSRIIAIHQENGGYGKAVNHGLKVATGEYIGIVESDDFIEPNMYEKLYVEAKRINADIIKCNFFSWFIENNQKISSQMEKKLKNAKFPCSINEIPTLLYFHPSIWSCIYKKDLIKEHKIFMNEIPGAAWQDNLFQVQTLILSQRISFISDILYTYRKFNLNESLDLKDAMIPYNRSMEIHKWLKTQSNITDDVWAFLIKREIAYMHIIIDMRGGINHLKRVKNILLNWVNGLPQSIVQTNKFFEKKEHEFLKRISTGKLVWLIFYKYKRYFRLKTIRRFFFSINTKKDIFCIQLLGIQVSKNFDHRPALIKIKL
ncbi:MAG: glycosyltransferase [Alphaproteobacteria bacterium]|nr:glycosyltransferase [Alphaproteobacteria bacterium]